MTPVDGSNIADRVIDAFDVPRDQDRQTLEGLTRALLNRLPPVVERDVDKLAAIAQSVHRFISERSSDVKVRAFNPTLEEHGFTAAGTVVQLNCEDSPFLLDSVTNEIRAHDLGVAYVLHPVVGVERSLDGKLTAVRHARHTTARESVEHYQLDRRLFDADLPAFEHAIAGVVGDVKRAVRDFHPMLARVDRMIELVRVSGAVYSEATMTEAVAFLQWLKDDNFVLLGYREYRLGDLDGEPAVQVQPGTGLGILDDEDASRMTDPVPLSKLPEELADRYRKGDLLVISKTNRISTIHRRARMDYIGVRILGQDGQSAGEARLVGLFTSKAYMEPVAQTPILRRKLAEIVAGEDLIEGSHDYKTLIELVEGFSKHDLFAAPVDDLRRTLSGLLALQERNHVRLFVRRDLFERSIHVLVALPRDRFNAELRRRVQAYLMDRLEGKSVDYHLAMGDSNLTQMHFTVWVDRPDLPEVPYEEIEEAVVSMARSWSDELMDVLIERHGESDGRSLVDAWAGRFPDYYRSATSLDVSAGDVEHLQELEQSGDVFRVGIQNEAERGQSERLTRIALYRRGGKLPLTQLMPALEDLGLDVVEEVPTRLAGEGSFFIHDFGVMGPGGLLLDVDGAAKRIADALEAVWSGDSDTDDLNRLVVLGGLTHRQVEILRALRTYWRRVAPVFTVSYVNDTLVSHAGLTARLMRLFELRFDPAETGAGYAELEQQIIDTLDKIPSLEEDRILRAFLRLIQASVRTNAYQPDRRALSFKLKSSLVPDAPLPHPLWEIFVICPTVEGIHLRGGEVARGGIRWSTRREDYRTEVLGLMKAQVTKNAVIVPTGAKGGFVLRRPPEDAAELRAEVEEQYRTFIGGLLDITDNLVEQKAVHPGHTRIHDGDDPYLVVAADKGTATFSDTANAIAAERDFWLDDAFASGGSSGYDHKALGITARGAWESAKRHFLEMEIDPERDVFTATGIGDMSGDVFGNGMLRSSTMKLVAAFDHRDIFLDPDPDPARSFDERQRLFELPRSSWADYDESLISAGGGVFSRSLKRIDLSPEIRTVLDTTAESVTPAELVSIILMAPVDLLWNGGIGTYVKASTETHDDVGDRTNDAVRVNGTQLRARVVVEGGNLGLTQAGRIEFAERGGRINTDFIDNAGGVDCSDREVNLKILLGIAERAGELTRADRDELIAAVSDDVVERILYGNFQQAQMISQEERAAKRRYEAYEELMVELAAEGILDREIEGLPSTEELADRLRSGRPLTRPELSVLLADAKRSLEDSIGRSDLLDDPYFLRDVEAYFPDRVVERFGHHIPNHPLRRSLTATLLANDVVDSEGVVFVSRLASQTGAEPANVVTAYRLARDVLGAVPRWEAIEDAFGTIEPALWNRLMRSMDRTVAAVTRWYLTHEDARTLTEIVEQDRPLVEELISDALTTGPESWQLRRAQEVDGLLEAGVPENIARNHASLSSLMFAPDVIDLARETGRRVAEVFDVYLHVGRAFGLDTLTGAARRVELGDRWDRWALWTIEEDLLSVRRRAAQRVIEVAGDKSGGAAVDAFLTARAGNVARLVRFMQTVDSEDDRADIPRLTVALRQVRAAIS